MDELKKLIEDINLACRKLEGKIEAAEKAVLLSKERQVDLAGELAAVNEEAVTLNAEISAAQFRLADNRRRAAALEAELGSIGPSVANGSEPGRELDEIAAQKKRLETELIKHRNALQALVQGDPVAESPQEPVMDPHTPDSAPLGFTAARILFADSNESTRQQAREILEAQGCEVDDVADGYQVLQRMANERFDLLIMDMMLPGKNGWDVCSALRARAETRAIPVLFLTSKFYPPASGKSGDGPVEFFQKPVEAQRLMSAVGHLLAARNG